MSCDNSPFNKGSVTLHNIELLRNNLIVNINNLMENRHRFRPDDWTSLMNYQRFSLNILDNMRNIKIVENNNPFIKDMHTIDRKLDTSPYYDDIKKVYNHAQPQTWQSQFDPKVINPQIFSLPPSNMWSIKKPCPDIL